MPKIPVVTLPGVSTQALPVQFENLNTDLGADSLKQGVAAIAKGASAVVDVVEKYQMEADDSAVMRAEAAFENDSSKLLYAAPNANDPAGDTGGYFTRSGRNALDHHTGVVDGLQGAADRAASNLTNDRQKKKFWQRVQGTLQQRMNQVEQHTTHQIESTKDADFKTLEEEKLRSARLNYSARVQTGYDETPAEAAVPGEAVALDPNAPPSSQSAAPVTRTPKYASAVQREIDMMRAPIMAQGARKGWSAKQVESELRNFSEKAHEQALEGYLSHGDWSGALDYYGQHEIDLGPRADKYRNQMKELGVSVDADRNAGQIVANVADPFTGRIDMAKAGKAIEMQPANDERSKSVKKAIAAQVKQAAELAEHAWKGKLSDMVDEGITVLNQTQRFPGDSGNINDPRLQRLKGLLNSDQFKAGEEWNKIESVWTARQKHLKEMSSGAPDSASASAAARAMIDRIESMMPDNLPERSRLLKLKEGEFEAEMAKAGLSKNGKNDVFQAWRRARNLLQSKNPEAALPGTVERQVNDFVRNELNLPDTASGKGAKRYDPNNRNTYRQQTPAGNTGTELANYISAKLREYRNAKVSSGGDEPTAEEYQTELDSLKKTAADPSSWQKALGKVLPSVVYTPEGEPTLDADVELARRNNPQTAADVKPAAKPPPTQSAAASIPEPIRKKLEAAAARNGIQPTERTWQRWAQSWQDTDDGKAYLESKKPKPKTGDQYEGPIQIHKRGSTNTGNATSSAVDAVDSALGSASSAVSDVVGNAAEYYKKKLSQ